MNKKAQMNLIGGTIIAFVAIIVGLAILNGGIFQNIGETTQLAFYNTTSGDDAVTATTSEFVILRGKAVSDLLVINSTDGIVIVDVNYTTLDNQLVNDVLTAVWNCSGDLCRGQTVNLSYNYQRPGYVDSSGGRSLVVIVAIFASLAVAIAALLPALQSKVMGN